MNVLVTIALPDSFEYLCYAFPGFLNIFTITVRGSIIYDKPYLYNFEKLIYVLKIWKIISQKI